MRTNVNARLPSRLPALAAVLLGLAGTLAGASPAIAVSAADLQFPGLDSSTSLLVVAPHPDDEVLCCAGVIQRVVRAGGKVGVVWITSGDASELDLLIIEKSLFLDPAKLRDLARTRMLEARSAASLLGVPADRQIFLGYPDRGLLTLLTDCYATPFFSKYNGASSVPYLTALSPGNPYTGTNLERDFDLVINRFEPTLVLAPSPRDAHADHEGAGVLTMRAFARRGNLAAVRYWVVHGGGAWPLPRGYHPSLKQYPAPRSKGLTYASFELTQTEVTHKLDALHLYRTQMRVMSSYLLSFIRMTELYSTDPMPHPPQGTP